MGNPEEAERETQFARHDDGGAPPPYDEAVGPFGQEAQKSTEDDGRQEEEIEISEGSSAMLISPHSPFPSVMDARYQLKISKTFHMGDDANPKMYALSVHTDMGLSSKWRPGKPGMVLYNGSSNKDPMLAAFSEVRNYDMRSLTTIVTLPSLPGSSEPYTTEKMMARTSPEGIACFMFSIEVGRPGQTLRREDFEWRKCKGEEKQQFIEQPWATEFTLRRLSPGSSSAAGTTTDKNTSTATGKEEVVAAFAWNHGRSLMNPIKLIFMGDGIPGALGDRWAIMAIITANRLWYLKHQGRDRSTVIARGEAAGDAASHS